MHVELGIDIDARGQQRVDEVHMGYRRSAANVRATWASACATSTTCAPRATQASATAAFFTIDDDVESSASPPIPHIRIATMIQQEFCGVVVIVIEGNYQWRDTLWGWNIDVRSRRDERLDAFQTTPARRVQERRQSSGRTILRAGLGSDLARPVAVLGTGFNIGALRKKQLHHLGGVPRCGRGPH